MCSDAHLNSYNNSIMAKRVLVLGGTSYVAQFLLQQYLNASERSSAQANAPPALTVACTMRGDRDAMCKPLPPSFHTVSLSTPSNSTDVSSLQHTRVQVYWNVDLATMTGVRECIRHFRPDVVINCIGAFHTPALHVITKRCSNAWWLIVRSRICSNVVACCV